MVALEVDDIAGFDLDAFDEFVQAQPDLGPKWVPSFVRIAPELPKLASMKIDKTRLRREGWDAPAVCWRPARGDQLRPMTATDVAALAPLRMPT
jgi:fatty-acyl-CoA synthase